MGFLVTGGAMMMCTMGAAPASMNVLPVGMVNAGPQAAATAMDNAPMLNIAPVRRVHVDVEPAGRGGDRGRDGRPDADAVHAQRPRPLGAGIPDRADRRQARPQRRLDGDLRVRRLDLDLRPRAVHGAGAVMLPGRAIP
jgi:hypothetical protein